MLFVCGFLGQFSLKGAKAEKAYNFVKNATEHNS